MRVTCIYRIENETKRIKTTCVKDRISYENTAMCAKAEHNIAYSQHKDEKRDAYCETARSSITSEDRSAWHLNKIIKKMSIGHSIAMFGCFVSVRYR